MALPLFMLAVLGAVLAMPYVSIRLARGWSGNWGRLALLPLLALGLAGLNILVGVLIDPTAHNLWPLEIAMTSVGGLVYLGALALARRLLLEEGAGGAVSFSRLADHPLVRWSALGLGLFLVAHGVRGLAANEGRGAAAAIVVGAAIIYRAAVGRMP
ncbi:MAG TPA: hypothetical protein VF188_06615 [Longimicrobiales bacterium]